jgi:uncharacterized protein YcfJ
MMLFTAGYSGAAVASDQWNFRTYATVVSAEPVMETRYEQVSSQVCDDPDTAAREFREVAASIGEDIRRQTRLWEQHRSCRTVTETLPRQYVAAYRVTYRYRGRTYTTRTARHPGERMLVNVSLSTMP